MHALRNAWYPLALAQELVGDVLLQRVLLERPYVLYRTAQGHAVALEDRCPHRFAPLSLGQRMGDDVQCAYHGLRFSPDGGCSVNPHGDGAIPKAATVRSLPVQEHAGLVWVWAGDAAQADRALLPDLSFFGSVDDPSVFQFHIESPAHYETVLDNLLDLTHADFLHPALLSSHGAMLRNRPEVTELPGRGLRVTHRMDGQPAMLLFRDQMPEPEAAAQTALEITWLVPTVVSIAAVVRQPGHPGHVWPETIGLQILAPKDRTSTHYFSIGRRNFVAEDAELTQLYGAAARRAFTDEDGPMLRAVQQAMHGEDLWAEAPVMLSCDAGAVRVRRHLQQMIEREQAGAGAVTGTVGA